MVFWLNSVSQVSVRTMTFISKCDATNSVSSSLFAMDLTLASSREGRWLLSNITLLAFPWRITAYILWPVVIDEVIYIKVGTWFGIDIHCKTAIRGFSDHSVLSS